MSDRLGVRVIRRVVRTALVVAAVVAGACSDATSPPGPNDSVRGDFALSTVDGQTLPHAIYDEIDYKLEVLLGTVRLEANGAFTIAMSTRETVAGAISMYADTTRGTYVQNGAVIGFTLQPGGATGTASWDGSQLTFVQIEDQVTTTYVYMKN